jgi:predicted amidohydrolase
VLYNSQILVNKALDIVHTSRKVFLYDDDKLWAEAGTSFNSYDLLFPRLGKSVRVGTGICMDINWKDFAEGEHVNMELATHQLQSQT